MVGGTVKPFAEERFGLDKSWMFVSCGWDNITAKLIETFGTTVL
jgi:hypothetical protein